MSEVFLCQTGQLSTTSKRDLRKAGIVVVEVDDPSTCQFIRSSEGVAHDDMLWACLHALNSQREYSGKASLQREQLAKNLFHIIMQARRTPSEDGAS